MEKKVYPKMVFSNVLTNTVNLINDNEKINKTYLNRKIFSKVPVNISDGGLVHPVFEKTLITPGWALFVESNI